MEKSNGKIHKGNSRKIKNEVWTYNPFMKFALLNDNRIEATKGAKGVCPIM
jgi:hypothetical protein